MPHDVARFLLRLDAPKYLSNFSKMCGAYMNHEWGRCKSIMRNLPLSKHPTSNGEALEPRRIPETTPPPIQEELEDDTRIMFTSWDCALVQSSR